MEERTHFMIIIGKDEYGSKKSISFQIPKDVVDDVYNLKGNIDFDIVVKTVEKHSVLGKDRCLV